MSKRKATLADCRALAKLVYGADAEVTAVCDAFTFHRWWAEVNAHDGRHSISVEGYRTRVAALSILHAALTAAKREGSKP